MEKYLKIRGCQIQERDLVATICDYCLDFRVRSPTILRGVAEYFVHTGSSLSTPQLFSMTRIFGMSKIETLSVFPILIVILF